MPRAQQQCRSILWPGAIPWSAIGLTGAASGGGQMVEFGPPVLVDQSLGAAWFEAMDLDVDGQTDLAAVSLSSAFALQVGAFINSRGGFEYDILGSLDGQPFDPQVAAALEARR